MEIIDIVPGLLERIKRDFEAAFKGNQKIEALYARVRDGTATYAEINEFAIETGEALAYAFQENLSSAELPDGRLYYNIANRIIPERLRENYELVSEVAMQVQQKLNEAAGIGIKAIRPEFNDNRAEGIVNRVSAAESYDDVAWVLKEPVVNFTQAVVDDTVRANADFHFKSGLHPRIIRTVTGGCCEWCAKVAGIYDYEEVMNTGNNVFRRHERCRCTVDFDPGTGKRQNVHTKQWHKASEDVKIKTRKEVGLMKVSETPKQREERVREENGLGLAEQLEQHPLRLQSYTPETLKEALQKAGYEVKPLARGSLKGVAFEDGGGYKVNYGGDGILQYHPADKSHHKGEYYKISSGKGGVRRYDRDGNKKDD